jgi:YVTN family beta-propeller protein
MPIRRPLLLLAATATLAVASVPAPAAAVPPPPAGPFPRLSRATSLAAASPAERPSHERRLELVRVIGGSISPKSVVATGTGEVWAQNEIFRHTMTVYGPKGSLLATISDRVRLSRFGFARWDEPVRGGPVEAAISPDQRTMYVSQRAMYGPGFPRPAPMDPTCHPSDGYDRSFVYAIDRTTRRIKDVYRVGSTPKFLAVTPDGATLLVANWCSYDLSVVDLTTGQETRRIKLGPYPRGIVVTPDGREAWIAVMGSPDLARLDLATWKVRWMRDVGWNPRHLVLDPAGRFLYVTLDWKDEVAKIDLTTRKVVRRVHTGAEPRSMAIADDGRSLYVGNYEDDTLVKLRARDLRILQRVSVPGDPIGVAYEPTTDSVWVSSYQGTIRIFRDR